MMVILQIPVNLIKALAGVLFGSDPISQKMMRIRGQAEAWRGMAS